MSTLEKCHHNTLDIVIPSYQRGHVLLDTIEYLRIQINDYTSLIIVDQTVYNEGDGVANKLQTLSEQGEINWIREDKPSIPNAMNIGLLAAESDIVLFLDDDIIPAGNLISEHLAAYSDPSIVASVGQVLQPNEQPKNINFPQSSESLDEFDADLSFPFYSTAKQYIQNCMAGNLSVDRKAAIACGGFDANFVGVAYRFETEFCRRLLRHSQARCLFFPAASIQHLKVPSGGTRSNAKNFMSSIMPDHSVGEYYFVLRETKGLRRLYYLLRRYLGSLKARFYLFKPWWIPVRMIAETRGFFNALRLFLSEPKHIQNDR